MASIKDHLMNTSEKVIDTLELDDFMETFDFVGEWIMEEHPCFMIDSSSDEIAEDFRKTVICPQCGSFEGSKCDCFTRERL